MQFEWDENKRRSNHTKHGVDFIDAVKSFADPQRIEGYDESHSNEEDRWWTIAKTPGKHTTLFVIYTERVGGLIRLVSARKASKHECEAYNKG